MLWLFVCLFIPFIANAAHFGGLLFGAAVGAAIRWKGSLRETAFAGIAVLIGLPVGTLFWCPWSWMWNGVKAENAYNAGDYKNAIAYLERASRLVPDSQWILANLAEAYEKAGDLSKAEETVGRAGQAKTQRP